MIDWTAIAAAIGSITTLAGSYGGYLLAGRNEEARDKRADHREAAARRAALGERLEEERHTFQRDTLLELQDVLLQLMRWRGLVNAQDLKTLKERGQLFLLPDELGGDEPRLAIASAQRLRTRVLDSDLRAAIDEFIAACARDSTDLRGADPADAIKEIERRDLEVATRYVALAEKIGERLRMELDRRILADEIERRRLKRWGASLPVRRAHCSRSASSSAVIRIRSGRAVRTAQPRARPR